MGLEGLRRLSNMADERTSSQFTSAHTKTLTKNKKQLPKELSLNVYSVTNVVFKMRVSQ